MASQSIHRWQCTLLIAGACNLANLFHILGIYKIFSKSKTCTPGFQAVKLPVSVMIETCWHGDHRGCISPTSHKHQFNLPWRQRVASECLSCLRLRPAVHISRGGPTNCHSFACWQRRFAPPHSLRPACASLQPQEAENLWLQAAPFPVHRYQPAHDRLEVGRPCPNKPKITPANLQNLIHADKNITASSDAPPNQQLKHPHTATFCEATSRSTSTIIILMVDLLQ